MSVSSHITDLKNSDWLIVSLVNHILLLLESTIVFTFIVESSAKIHCFSHKFTNNFVVCLILSYNSKLIVESVEPVSKISHTLYVTCYINTYCVVIIQLGYTHITTFFGHFSTYNYYVLVYNYLYGLSHTLQNIYAYIYSFEAYTLNMYELSNCLVVVSIIIYSYTTIKISRIITILDISWLECIGSHSMSSFHSMRVEIVVLFIRKIVVVAWIIAETLINPR